MMSWFLSFCCFVFSDFGRPSYNRALNISKEVRIT